MTRQQFIAWIANNEALSYFLDDITRAELEAMSEDELDDCAMLCALFKRQLREKHFYEALVRLPA